MSISINKEFIHSLEGGFRTKGYVPKAPSGKVLGHSGVTVGTGVDLGTKTDQYFKGIGISSELIEKLKPYLGKQKSEADLYLREHHLTLSEVEVKSLSEAVLNENVESVKSQYDKATKFKDASKKGFEKLTVNQRTVICSVLFQYGSPKRVPTFWNYATEQDWNKVENELRNFKDKYPTRRNKEADLLMKK